ncbi:MAG TPA: ABC transporter substrate-binding protein [Candidatus Polarisedimenticolia bacterium]|jgi:multiple sugar transport system substrate-binding protein|nr:ABC transporter substrate-binding protein [Candidatus Polarisedimenticolia bacterium]
MKQLRTSFALALAISMLAVACGPSATPTPSGSGAISNEPFVMLSTQFNTVTESEAVRKQILAGFTIAPVDFLGAAAGPFVDRITAETKTSKGQVGVIGGVHGDFAGFNDLTIFEDLTPLAQKLKDRGIAQEFLDLGKLGTNRQVYIPWMQATYIMGINKQALQYLPSGVKETDITYKQLRDWCKNIFDKTGQKRCGLPAGPMSLLHRLIQGYMYPAYTGGLVTTYKSADAVTMWQDLKDLWQYVNPVSLNTDFMQEALLSGQVWVGFDHVARLVDALKQKPNDFVAVPAPKGPKGLYYMSVLAGLAIPKSSPNKAGAEAFIDYMTTADVQGKTLNAVAFFPVLDKPLPSDLPAYLKAEADAVQAQSKAPDAKVALLPIGLGAKGGEFNKVQLDTFQRIVVKGEDIQKVLNEQAVTLQAVMNDTKAPCWRPDPASTGPCQVK